MTCSFAGPQMPYRVVLVLADGCREFSTLTHLSDVGLGTGKPVSLDFAAGTQ